MMDKQNQAFILAVSFIAFLFLYVGVTVFVGKIDQQIVSILSNIVMVIVGYYFGSSKSSATKDETIASMASKPEGS